MEFKELFKDRLATAAVHMCDRLHGEFVQEALREFYLQFTASKFAANMVGVGLSNYSEAFLMMDEALTDIIQAQNDFERMQNMHNQDN